MSTTQGNIVSESEAEQALGSSLYQDLGSAPAPRRPLDPNAPAFVPKTTGTSRRRRGHKKSKKATRKARKTRRR